MEADARRPMRHSIKDETLLRLLRDLRWLHECLAEAEKEERISSNMKKALGRLLDRIHDLFWAGVFRLTSYGPGDHLVVDLQAPTGPVLIFGDSVREATRGPEILGIPRSPFN